MYRFFAVIEEMGCFIGLMFFCFFIFSVICCSLGISPDAAGIFLISLPFLCLIVSISYLAYTTSKNKEALINKSIKIFASILFLVGIITSICYFHFQNKYNSLLEEANNLKSNGNYDDAEWVVAEAMIVPLVNKSKANRLYYEILDAEEIKASNQAFTNGLNSFKNGNFKEAMNYFNDVIEEDKKNYNAVEEMLKEIEKIKNSIVVTDFHLMKKDLRTKIYIVSCKIKNNDNQDHEFKLNVSFNRPFYYTNKGVDYHTHDEFDKITYSDNIKPKEIKEINIEKKLKGHISTEPTEYPIFKDPNHREYIVKNYDYELLIKNIDYY